MYLYNEGETEGQGRFFSPAKIARVRERILAASDAQRQHQLIAQDKKLQLAISRAEKAREAEERKQQRQLARQAVREQLVREKAERQTIREDRRAQKTTKAATRKREVAERLAQRIQAKEAKEAGVRSKKRSLKDEEVDQPRKRSRTNASRIRNAGSQHTSSIQLDTRIAQQSSRTILETEIDFRDIYQGIELEGQISYSRRFGRALRLPTRFR